MKFELYCASSSENDDTPVQISGCGIILIATDDDRVVTKKFEYGLGSSSKFRADLLCARLALASIKPVYRCNKTILYVDNRRIQSVFDTAIDEYYREYEALMRWYKYYHDISVRISDNQTMAEVKSMASTAMRTQEHREY